MGEFRTLRLKKLLKIQPNVKELKSKYIDSSKDIKEFLNNNKVMLFLNYLKENNIFIHYFNVNNLYFSIVDIVDSLDYVENFDIANTAKNTLYRLFIHYPEEFFKILKSHNYPNVENTKEFLMNLLELLEIYNDEYLKKYMTINNIIITNPNFEHICYEMLRQLLKHNYKNSNNLIFLCDNTTDTTVDDFSSYYFDRAKLFENYKCIFDIEQEIQKYLLEYSELSNKQNFIFEDSKKYIEIQISDCLVGIIGKFWRYLNNIFLYELESFICELNENQINNLHFLIDFLKLNDAKCDKLIKNIQSIDDNNKIMILDELLKTRIC